MTEGLKICRKCHLEKPITEFTITDSARGYRKARCKVCEAERVRAYYAANPDYRATVKRKALQWRADNPQASRSHQWKTGLKYKFGMSAEQYHALLEQQEGCCALCRAPVNGRDGQSGRHDGSRDWSDARWNVDHDHGDGHVRGLLCHTCNTQLGGYETLLAKVGELALLDYLTRPCPIPAAPPPVLPEYRHVEILPARYTRREREACTMAGCERPEKEAGLCGMHYARRLRSGETGPAEELPRGTVRGAAHKKSKLTEDDVRAILASGEKGVVLAERYGVTTALISNIRLRKTWKHVA